MKGLKYCENYQNVTLRHEVRKCCQKNGADRFVRYRVATNLRLKKEKMQYLQSAIKKAQ